MDNNDNETCFFDVAKKHKHDLFGVKHPQYYSWIKGHNGIYYPHKKLCLFEHYELQPEELAKVIAPFEEEMMSEGESYDLCRRMLAAVEAVGFTFGYYLDAMPYDLFPIEEENDNE